MEGEEHLEPSLLHQALQEVVRDNPDAVRRWMDNTPGAWGNLAGKAVLAVRRRRGRRLTDSERRQVWHELWGQLTKLKNVSPTSPDD